MRLLLDTHTLLWLMESGGHLSNTAESLLVDPVNQLHISVVSLWEISLKVGLKKLGLAVHLATFLDTAVKGYDLIVLPLTMADCLRYGSLPFPDTRHRDPFDRMIVTQALQHEMAVVGSDIAFDDYGVTRLW